MLFNGVPASLLNVSPARLDVVVPYGLAGTSSVDVVVRRYYQNETLNGVSSDPFTVAVQDTAPVIVTTAASDGTLQPLIYNATGNNLAPLYALNTAANPAVAGSQVRIYATGGGVWDPPLPDGTMAVTNRSPVAPVSVTIGGLDAKVVRAVQAPFDATPGKMAVDVVVPKELASTGAQPVVLKVGGYDTAAQSITLNVQ